MPTHARGCPFWSAGTANDRQQAYETAANISAMGLPNTVVEPAHVALSYPTAVPRLRTINGPQAGAALNLSEAAVRQQH